MSFDFKKDPIENFLVAYSEVQKKGVPDAHAMSLASVDPSTMKPSNRIVYYKGMIDGGLSFYTNYQGRKGQELEKNKFVCANFFWTHVDQQVRFDGYVEKLSETQSDNYFWSRPRLSQIGAWTSLQSQNLNSFDDFHQRFSDFEKKFQGQKVPRPPHWGGFQIVPLEIEFWFGRAGRLHERYVYSRSAVNQQWQRSLRFP